MPSATKEGTGELRHDLEPLTTRFPQLVNVESATWMSGTMGDSGAPGPSTYWIDAIIELPVAEHAELLGVASAEGRGLPEEFSPELLGLLPTESLSTSDELDERFSDGSFSSKIYVVSDDRTLILSTVFQ